MYDFIVLQSKRSESRRIQSFSFYQSAEETEPPVALSQLIQLSDNDCKDVLYSSRMIRLLK